MPMYEVREIIPVQDVKPGDVLLVVLHEQQALAAVEKVEIHSSVDLQWGNNGTPHPSPEHKEVKLSGVTKDLDFKWSTTMAWDTKVKLFERGKYIRQIG